MKGHARGQCKPIPGQSQTVQIVSPDHIPAATNPTAATADNRAIMPGSYGRNRPSELSVHAPKLLERIGPKLEEPDENYYIQQLGQAGENSKSSLQRLMSHPTIILDDELGPEHSISQVDVCIPNNPSQSLALASFSSWVAPESSAQSTISYQSLAPRSEPSTLPLNNLLKVAGAKQLVHVIEVERKFIAPVLRSAASEGVFATCIAPDDGYTETDAFFAREPPKIRVVLSKDADAIARYQQSISPRAHPNPSHSRLVDVRDYAIGQMQEDKARLSRELQEARSRPNGMGFGQMIGAGTVGALALLFILRFA